MRLSLFFFGLFVPTQPMGDVPRYRAFLDAAKLADDLGLCAVWTPERHFQEFGGLYGSPGIIGAALAVLTKRIGIRAGSIVLPLQNPLRVAEEWAMIDNLSGGRAALAFAPGWHVNDFVLSPETFRDRYADMFAKIEVIRKLWRGETVRLPNGAGKEIDVGVLPRPVQKEPPLWLTCMSDETFALAGELGFNVFTANFVNKDIAELGRRIALYRRESEKHHGKRGHVTLISHAFGADSEESIERLARPALERFLSVNIDMQIAQDRGSGIDRGFASLSERRKRSMANVKADLLIGGELGCIGTIERCRSRASAWSAAGVDEVAGLIDFGVGVEPMLESLHRLRALDGAG